MQDRARYSNSMRQWFLSLGSRTREQLIARSREGNPNWLDEEVVHWAESKVQVSPNVVQTFDQPEPPWRDALPRIACPILLITADPVDQLVTPADVQEMAGLWREGKVVQIEGAGHMVHSDRYEPFVEAVQAFLAEICAGLARGGCCMSTQENETIVRRLWEEVWNQKALDVCDEIFDAEYAEHEKSFALHGLAAFPDSHHTIEDMIAQDDKVVTRFTWRGTHRGEFQGIPPTGKQVEMKGIWIHRLAGGQIVEGRQSGVVDMLGVLQQLGATITPPAPGEV